jgi:hypothetical protein
LSRGQPKRRLREWPIIIVVFTRIIVIIFTRRLSLIARSSRRLQLCNDLADAIVINRFGFRLG